MKVLVVLCGLMALTLAHEGCGPLQKLKVKQQWMEVYGEGHHRQDFGTAVFKSFLAHEPESKKLFDRVHVDDIHSPEFQAHIARVMGGLDMAIALLDNEDTLHAQLDHLRHQHDERHIPGNYFDVFGEVLFEVVPAALGKCYDHEAWEACYKIIADGIKEQH